MSPGGQEDDDDPPNPTATQKKTPAHSRTPRQGKARQGKTKNTRCQVLGGGAAALRLAGCRILPSSGDFFDFGLPCLGAWVPLASLNSLACFKQYPEQRTQHIRLLFLFTHLLGYYLGVRSRVFVFLVFAWFC